MKIEERESYCFNQKFVMDDMDKWELIEKNSESWKRKEE